ncbi:MAG: sugar phosphate isomerase/epimerase [Spirochaetales bacterium]|jgi:sugar phosphate isomerase/epimerase|nr:sugar phosphate isomerase/epimerase [Spirochaetales bacterium]
MIKLSTMTSVCPDWEISKIIDKMQEYGYTGLEPRVDWGHAAGIEFDMPSKARDELRLRVEDAGLTISCVATGARFASPDAAETEKCLEEARNGILLAADLGCPYLRTFGGERGDGEVYFMVKRAAENYQKILDLAEEKGVTILMETHDSWCVSSQVRAVVLEVDHPNLKVLWDLMHPQRFMEKPEETMVTVGSLTRHLHAHDGVYGDQGEIEPAPLGEGVFDHATPLKLLNDAGFDGYFSVEVIHKPGSEHDADGVLSQYARVFKGMIE